MSEKTMTSELKSLSPKMFEEIKKAGNILLSLHPRPDFDSIGSNLAMFHALKAMGKRVALIKGDSELPKFAKFFPGYEKIEPKSFSEADIGQFDLFIILDVGAKDRVSEAQEIEFPSSLKTIVIDHHDNGEEFADINLIDSSSPATCQMVYGLLEEWGIKITREIAVCLFAGIYYDTGGFVYEKTGKDTFLAAAKLFEVEAGLGKNILGIEKNRSFKEVVFRGLALGRVENFFSGKTALIALPFGELKKNGFDNGEASGSMIISEIMKIEGVIFGVAMIEEDPGKVKISFRSSDAGKYDVGKIASIFGGGGHKAAAGAIIKKSLAEAKKMILEAIIQTYPDIGVV